MKSIDECLDALMQIQQFLKSQNGVAANAPAPTTDVELANLLQSIDWPVAVDPFLIVSTESEDDKMMRAEGIIELVINTNLGGMKFLDFGCGEGHVVKKSLDFNTKQSVGYDIVRDQHWDGFPASPNMLFSTNYDEIKANGPYDYILVYDVVDHAVGDTPVQLLKKVKDLMAPNGKVHIRFHPWCSRHGTHLYRQINKAYIHLVFSEEQLVRMGYKPMTTVKVVHPQATYSGWLAEAGFTKTRIDNITSEEVPAFFRKTDYVSALIKAHWKDSFVPALANGSAFPDDPMRKQFMDYIVG